MLHVLSKMMGAALPPGAGWPRFLAPPTAPQWSHCSRRSGGTACSSLNTPGCRGRQEGHRLKSEMEQSCAQLRSMGCCSPTEIHHDSCTASAHSQPGTRHSVSSLGPAPGCSTWGRAGRAGRPPPVAAGQVQHGASCTASGIGHMKNRQGGNVGVWSSGCVAHFSHAEAAMDGQFAGTSPQSSSKQCATRIGISLTHM